VRRSSPEATACLASSGNPVGFTSWGLLLLDALLGVAVLRGRWREALAVERAQPAPSTRPALG